MKRECPEMIECMNGNDIVLFSETWTNEHSNLDIDDFVVFSKHRVKKKNARRDSGGLVCYFRKNVAKGVSEMKWLFEDGMCFKLDKDYFGWERDVILLFVYMRARDSTREDMNVGLNCYDIVTDKLASIKDIGDVILVGDMNARVGTKDECMIETKEGLREREQEERNMRIGMPERDRVFCEDDFVRNNMQIRRINKDVGNNEYGNRLLHMTYGGDLAILNGRCPESDKNMGGYTFANHRGESAIDYVICDKYMLDKIDKFNVHDANEMSDHCMLTFDICTGCVDRDQNDRETRRGGRYAKWRSERRDEYVSNIESVEIEHKLVDLSRKLLDNIECDVLEEGVLNLRDIIIDAGAGHIKQIREGRGLGGRGGAISEEGDGGNRGRGGRNRNREGGGAWWDQECARQRGIFHESQRRHADLGTEATRAWMIMQRNSYRKLCRTKRREYMGQEAHRLWMLGQSDPNAFWKEVKGEKPKKETPKLDFFNHFSNLANRDSNLGEAGQEEIRQANEQADELYIGIVDDPIELKELEGAIKTLKTDKSAGEDLILNEFILNAPRNVKLAILMLFNNILLLEYFPSCWAVGNIVPIFKSGDKNDTNNYRGITILSCMGKLFTKILNNRLTKWAESFDVLDETQYGFRKSRSTVDCIFIIHGLIELLLAQGKQLFCVFIDYEKAFDYLDRAAMWAKLLKMGSSSKSVRLMKNMYSKIRLTVRGDEGRYFMSNLGLLQGESTSPILFSLFVNDLEGDLADDTIGTRVMDIIIKLIKFADDMAIFSETREGLQKGLNDLNDYCKKWGISVNVPKTKVVVFRKGGRLGINDRWHLNGVYLEVVSVFKYLGVWLGSTGSFSKCVSELSNSARRALFSLKSYFSKNPEILPIVQINLFNSMVLPILFYGSEVWGLCKADPIETFYLSFLKSVLNVKTSTTNTYVYGELGVFPLFVERQVRVLKYWAKIISGELSDNSYVTKVYKALVALEITKPREVTWVTLVRDLLVRCGMGDYWQTQRVECRRTFERLAKSRVYECYIREWKVNVESSTDGRLFKFIKDDFKFERYLNMNDRRLRVAITRIRLSSHLFFIERGRWSRPKVVRDNRVCDICNVVEDERHCLLVCPKFVNERRGRVPVWLNDDPSWNNFLRFLKGENEAELQMLGMLCKSVQNEHRSLL